MNAKIFVSLVLYNSLQSHSERAIERSIASVLEQESFELGQNLKFRIIDNASSDRAADFIEQTFLDLKSAIIRNKYNLGFCGAHNQAVTEFLNSDSDYFLLINPDLRLEPTAFKLMLAGFQSDSQVGMVTPKIIQADLNLDLASPPRLDAAGMEIFTSLRHFDRGQGRSIQEFIEPEFVFGGTGACLLLSRACICDLLLPKLKNEQLLNQVYPDLFDGSRAQLLDEAFFAYREDADLAWRALLFGWKTFYQPQALAYHRRVVRADNRSQLSPELNLLGVKNRFLLQINNLNWPVLIKTFWAGVIIRNSLVFVAVLVRERSSLGALWQVWKLLPRALEVRKYVQAKARSRQAQSIKSECLSRYFK